MGKGDDDGNWSTLDGRHVEPSTECYEIPLDTPSYPNVRSTCSWVSVMAWKREIAPETGDWVIGIDQGADIGIKGV
jgi:hypothetical protein